jgi:hypothetical protein
MCGWEKLNSTIRIVRNANADFFPAHSAADESAFFVGCTKLRGKAALTEPVTKREQSS